jgi:phage head maturation protease
MIEPKVFNYAINDGFVWCEVNLKGEKTYFIEGYASTIDEDKAGEILEMSAQYDIHNQICNENITMDIEHEEWYDANGKILSRPKNEKIPVARVVSSEVRPRGVWVKAQINTNLRSFKEVWGSIKDGFLKAFSIAFYPTQKAGGIIKHLNLVNITLTGSPVNPNATFAVSMKSASAWMDTQETQALTDATKEEKTMTDEVSDAVVAEVKTEEPTEVVAEVKAEPVVETESVEAIIKAMKEKQEVELKAMRDQIATLKAELEKPVMKATVPAEMPKGEPVFTAVSPLRLIG